MPYLKRKRLILTGFYLCCILTLGGEVYSLNVKDIIAYPVPFNPRTQILYIGYKPEIEPESVDKVSIDIYDINGDKVFHRSYTSLDNAIKWNGRNNKGRSVRSGLYIIKLRVENTLSGEYGSKIIRILISR